MYTPGIHVPVSVLTDCLMNVLVEGKVPTICVL